MNLYTKYTNLIMIVMVLVVVTVVMEWKKCGWLVVVYMMGVWEGERGVWFGVCMWLEWWWNKLGNMVPWDDTLGQSQIITLHYITRVMTRKWLTFKWGWWLYGVKNFWHCTTTTIHNIKYNYDLMLIPLGWIQSYFLIHICSRRNRTNSSSDRQSSITSVSQQLQLCPGCRKWRPTGLVVSLCPGLLTEALCSSTRSQALRFVDPI